MAEVSLCTLGPHPADHKEVLRHGVRNRRRCGRGGDAGRSQGHQWTRTSSNPIYPQAKPGVPREPREGAPIVTPQPLPSSLAAAWEQDDSQGARKKG